jgi:hypothetical protein
MHVFGHQTFDSFTGSGKKNSLSKRREQLTFKTSRRSAITSGVLTTRKYLQTCMEADVTFAATNKHKVSLMSHMIHFAVFEDNRHVKSKLRNQLRSLLFALAMLLFKMWETMAPFSASNLHA